MTKPSKHATVRAGNTRLPHPDVTGSVDLDDPADVRDAVVDLLQRHFPRAPLRAVRAVFARLVRLYRGEDPAFHACDTPYHDLGHALDVTLAMARLLAGHALSVPAARRISTGWATVGVLAALFHDVGYLRRRGDRRHRNGAAYTVAHVRRGGRFLRDLLPEYGLEAYAADAAAIVAFTAYPGDVSRIRTRDPAARFVGQLLGTADLIAQMADRRYLERCRDHLFTEFVEAGIAGPRGTNGYRTPDDLLRGSLDFFAAARARIEEGLGAADQLAAPLFNGTNPYREGMARNERHLKRVVRSGHMRPLRRRPKA